MASEKINEILSDATTLEVSSLLVEGISGRKMPGVAVAFLETVHAWVNQFETLAADLRIPDDLPLEAEKIKKEYQILKPTRAWLTAHDSPANQIASYEKDFSSLADDPFLKEVLDTEMMFAFQIHQRKQLKEKGEQPKARRQSSEVNRLMKIQMRLAKLRIYFLKAITSNVSDGFNKKSIDKNQGVNRDIQELRKLWDLKDGYIFAQNTVQLDGDIISRQNIRIYQDPYTKKRVTQLLDFHYKNVDIGIKHWHFIFETIISLAKSLGAAIVSPFK